MEVRPLLRVQAFFCPLLAAKRSADLYPHKKETTLSFNHTLSAVLRGRWLLHQQWANDHLPAVVMMLEGKEVNFSGKSQNFSSHVTISGKEAIARPYVVDPISLKSHSAFIYDYQSDRIVANPNIPPNSVAVLNIAGPITKYDGECGEPGAISLANFIGEIGARDNVSAIVMVIDTPGGEARAASTLVNAIQSQQKPVLAYVNGMCASLGVWISSAASEVYLSDKMDEMGSVGSYCSFLDFAGYMEKNGIKQHQIYAPQSTDKNKDFKDALAGDYTGIENELKIHVDEFIGFVSKSRGEKASANQDAWSTGKMFLAKDSVKIGLADGVMPFNRVITRAAFLAKQKK